MNEHPETYTVQHLGSGISFACRRDQTILDAIIRQNSSLLSTGCYGGGCGICRMQVLDGEVEVVKPMSRAHVSVEQEKQGILLLCCVQPRSNVRINWLQPAMPDK